MFHYLTKLILISVVSLKDNFLSLSYPPAFLIIPLSFFLPLFICTPHPLTSIIEIIPYAQLSRSRWRTTGGPGTSAPAWLPSRAPKFMSPRWAGGGKERREGEGGQDGNGGRERGCRTGMEGGRGGAGREWREGEGVQDGNEGRERGCRTGMKGGRGGAGREWREGEGVQDGNEGRERGCRTGMKGGRGGAGREWREGEGVQDGNEGRERGCRTGMKGWRGGAGREWREGEGVQDGNGGRERGCRTGMEEGRGGAGRFWFMLTTRWFNWVGLEAGRHESFMLELFSEIHFPSSSSLFVIFCRFSRTDYKFRYCNFTNHILAHYWFIWRKGIKWDHECSTKGLSLRDKYWRRKILWFIRMKTNYKTHYANFLGSRWHLRTCSWIEFVGVRFCFTFHFMELQISADGCCTVPDVWVHCLRRVIMCVIQKAWTLQYDITQDSTLYVQLCIYWTKNGNVLICDCPASRCWTGLFVPKLSPTRARVSLALKESCASAGWIHFSRGFMLRGREMWQDCKVL